MFSPHIKFTCIHVHVLNSNEEHALFFFPYIHAEREPPPYSNTSISSSQRSFDNPGPGPMLGSNPGSYSAGGYGSGSEYGMALPHHQFGALPPNAHTYSDIDMPISGQQEEEGQ